jgi:predicted PurR-regulated permease PerM
MTSEENSAVDQKFLANTMAAFIQIASVVVLIFWCFKIISPFLSVVIWGAIISIAVYPAHLALTPRLWGREKLSAVFLVLIGLAIIIIPAWMLTESSIDGLKYLAADFQDGSVRIPPPSDRVAKWPLVGAKVYDIWSGAATNLQTTLNKFAPQIMSIGRRALSLAGSGVVGIFQFIFSVIIAGALLTTGPRGYQAALNISAHLAGVSRGHELVDLSIATVRSVVKGVLGVAVIQMILSAIGLLVMGIPGAGLWAGAVLVLAIVQLPPILVLGPIAVWVFFVGDPVPASIFFIYCIFVSASDTFLKPMLLGRGVKVPMLVILIGAIGGVISQGIVGLFVGSVVLVLGYELFVAWMAPR